MIWWAEKGDLRLDHDGELFEALRGRDGATRGHLWLGAVAEAIVPARHAEAWRYLANLWADAGRWDPAAEAGQDFRRGLF